MTVIIGIDPHKSSHTAVASRRGERRAGEGPGANATRRQLHQLIEWAEPFERAEPGRSRPQGGSVTCFPSSSWPPARRSSTSPRPWPLGSGCWPRGARTRTTPDDARSVAIAALRCPLLRSVKPADEEAGVLRLLAKCNLELGDRRTQVVNRLHALFRPSPPGGIPRSCTHPTPSPSWPRCSLRAWWNRPGSSWPPSSSANYAASMPPSRRRTAGSARP